MYSDEFDWNRRTVPRKPQPPPEIFPESLRHYLYSIDESKVVYRFPVEIPCPQPNEEVLKRLRLTLDRTISMNPKEIYYYITFNYY